MIQLIFGFPTEPPFTGMGFECWLTTSMTGRSPRSLECPDVSLILDRANGITECPIPPGASKVYTFKAEQYGSSWYVVHFAPTGVPVF